jgi:hypothetical protein
MPTDGSGNYSLPDGSVAVNGDVIQASVHNTPLNDIAAGLSARVMANGFKAMTANLQMGGNKVIGLGEATVDGDAVRYQQFRVPATVGDAADHAGIAPLASEEEAEALADQNNTKIMTALRVKQAIFAWFATAAEIWSGAESRILTADKLVDAGAFVALTDDPTIATDCETGRNFEVTITDNRTLGAPASVKIGQVYTWKVTQGAGAPNTLSYHANFSFGDAVAPVLSSSEGDVDLIQFLAVSATKFAYMGARLSI